MVNLGGKNPHGLLNIPKGCQWAQVQWYQYISFYTFPNNLDIFITFSCRHGWNCPELGNLALLEDHPLLIFAKLRWKEELKFTEHLPCVYIIALIPTKKYCRVTITLTSTSWSRRLRLGEVEECPGTKWVSNRAPEAVPSHGVMAVSHHSPQWGGGGETQSTLRRKAK